MDSFKIISDSSCDIHYDLLKKFDVGFVPFYVSFDGSNYYKEVLDISIDEFYRKLVEEKALAKTSLPSVQDYADVFRPYFEQGHDILCFCLTSKFSGSYQSAITAGEMLKEEYPGRKIIIVDSIQATIGQGLIVLQAVYMRDAGYTLEKCYETIEKLKHTCVITFTVDSLEYLRRGGRLGLVSALLGSLLNIKPIIQLTSGELQPHSKSRGRKKALKDVLKIAVNLVADDKDSYDYCFANAACREEAEEFIRELKEEHGINLSLPLADVGVTIGCHTGPTALGIASVKNYKYV